MSLLLRGCAPARLLRDGDLDDVGAAIVAAERAFSSAGDAAIASVEASATGRVD
jgi:hypothetical protein